MSEQVLENLQKFGQGLIVISAIIAGVSLAFYVLSMEEGIQEFMTGDLEE